MNAGYYWARYKNDEITIVEIDSRGRVYFMDGDGQTTKISEVAILSSRLLPPEESKAATESKAEGGQILSRIELCQNCHQSNPVWFAPNLVWNSVVTEISGILCPMCFIARAERQGFECTGWQLVPETVQQLAELSSLRAEVERLKAAQASALKHLRGTEFVATHVMMVVLINAARAALSEARKET